MIAVCYFCHLGQEMAELEFGQQTQPSTNPRQRDETTNNKIFKIYHHINVSLKHIVTLKLIHEVKKTVIHYGKRFNSGKQSLLDYLS